MGKTAQFSSTNVMPARCVQPPRRAWHKEDTRSDANGIETKAARGNAAALVLRPSVLTACTILLTSSDAIASITCVKSVTIADEITLSSVCDSRPAVGPSAALSGMRCPLCAVRCPLPGQVRVTPHTYAHKDEHGRSVR
jgi:hypothetical protein